MRTIGPFRIVGRNSRYELVRQLLATSSQRIGEINVPSKRVEMTWDSKILNTTLRDYVWKDEVSYVWFLDIIHGVFTTWVVYLNPCCYEIQRVCNSCHQIRYCRVIGLERAHTRWNTPYNTPRRPRSSIFPTSVKWWEGIGTSVGVEDEAVSAKV